MSKVAAFIFPAAGGKDGIVGTATALVGIARGDWTLIAAGVAQVAGLMTPRAPDADSGKSMTKQAIPPRIRGYARRRIGGSLMLWTAKNNYAYDVVDLHHGEIEAIEQVWNHDDILTVRSDGWVEGGHGYGGGNSDLIHLETRLGLATETPYSNIVAALSGDGVWTSAHRGDGQASIGVDYHHAKQENLLADFPNGGGLWSVTGRLSLIWDPRDNSHSAKANMALIIMDFLCHPEGMGEDYATTVAPELAHWMGEADICDEPVPLKAGGTTPRYWGGGFYALTEDPQDVLTKMLLACDGRLFRTVEGVWKLWVGKYRAPTVFLTDADLLDYDLAGDAEEQEVVNELIPSFISEAHKWSLVATDSWVAEDDGIDTRPAQPAQPAPFALEWVCINSQARRLAKREMSRQRAVLRGRLDCRLSAVRVIGERWVGVEIDDLDMPDAVIEIERGARTAFSRGVVELPFIQADPDADAWNATTEEGLGPQVEDTLVREPLAPPTIAAVTVFADSLGESAGVRLRVTTVGPLRDDLVWSIRWRVSGAVSWIEMDSTDIDPGVGVALETGFVAAAPLQVETAYLTGGGSLSPWSSAFDVDATVEPPPYVVAPPTELDLTGGVGTIAVSWREPETLPAYEIIRHNTTNTTVGATALPNEAPIAPSYLRTVSLTGIATGTHYVFITAYDASAVPSATISAGPVTVT